MVNLSIQDIAKLLLERIKNDWDAAIAITGEEGSGKSTFALQLAMAVDPNFALQRNVMFSPSEKEMIDKVIHLPKYSAIVIDEAIKILYKLNWSSKIQIVLNQIYALARKENKVSLFCMPRFVDFNEYFRNHRLKMWIHISQRGKAFLFLRDSNPYSQDAWHVDDMRKIIKSRKRWSETIFSDLTIDEQTRLFKKNPCFKGIVSFKDLPAKLKKEYVTLRDSQKYDGFLGEKPEEMMGKREKIWKKRTLNFFKLVKTLFPFVSQDRIAAIVDKERPQFIMALRRDNGWDAPNGKYGYDPTTFFSILRRNKGKVIENFEKLFGKEDI